MKRFLAGVLVGVALTLLVQSQGPQILETLGVDPDAFSGGAAEVERGMRNLLEAGEDATEEVGRKVNGAGEKIEKILKE